MDMEHVFAVLCFILVSSSLQALCAPLTLTPPPAAAAAPVAAPEGNHTQPATCKVAGTEYSHGYQIPRADPCELCLCLDGELFCWWQDCPSASPACRESPAYAACADNTTMQLAGNEEDTAAATATDGTSEAVALMTSEAPLLAENSSSALVSTTSGAGATDDDSAPPGATERPLTTSPTVCRVMGTEYKVGEVLPRDTGTCLECVCDSEARVTCSPKDCASHDEFHASNNLDMFDVDTF